MLGWRYAKPGDQLARVIKAGQFAHF
jgi:hypothetical protein